LAVRDPRSGRLTAELQRYVPAKKRPSTLAQEFIAELLDIAGGSMARRLIDGWIVPLTGATARASGLTFTLSAGLLRTISA
jgi:hypothetical protein